MSSPHGYTYGAVELAPSPVTLAELELLKTTLLWSDADTAALVRAGTILRPIVQDVLDVWYGYVGANAHLLAQFNGSDGQPNGAYLDAVRQRFAAWIIDTCERPYDQAWLDYQHEIALRHYYAKKNVTDAVMSTSLVIPMRYLVAFIFPITATMRGFLERGADSAAELDAMHGAWFKAVTLTAVLWSQPYSHDW
jgi:Protoglobin